MDFLDFEFITFLFIAVIIFHLLNQKFRINFIILISIIFYMSYSIIHLSYMIVFTLLSYFIYRMVVVKGKSLLGYTLVFASYAAFIILNKIGFLHSYFIGLIPADQSKTIKYFITLYPIGISFHLLQTLSICADYHRSEESRVISLKEFFLSNFFFPKSLAGPIERISGFGKYLHFPTIPSARTYLRATELFIIGASLKVLVANPLSSFINPVFADYTNFSTFTLLQGLFFFRVQLYADFYGYFLMAYAMAKMFGVKLTVNFLRPYCSVGFSDHWRKWNITLGAWFRDYVMFPLSHRMVTRFRMSLLVILVFIGVGVWHGLDKKYLIWGLINGLFVSIEGSLLRTFLHKIKAHKLKAIRFMGAMVTLFFISLISVFIRADSSEESFSYLEAIVNNMSVDRSLSINLIWLPLLIYVIFEVTNWVSEFKGNWIRFTDSQRVGLSVLLLVLLFIFGNSGYRGFLYFQF